MAVISFPEKPVQLFDQFSLGSGTTVRATFDVAPDGRFLLNMNLVAQEQGEERLRKIFPSSLRFVLNWSQEARRLLSTPR